MHWSETSLAGLLDQPLLAALDLQQRTLLTRDVNSIPDFLADSRSAHG
jgi:hypothetical protein